MYAKVEALLAKAASTNYDAEAEACFAKAQDLITKYQLDERLLGHHDTLTSETWWFEAPYSLAKVTIAYVVCEANGIRAVTGGKAAKRYLKVIGFSNDIKMARWFSESAITHANVMLAQTRRDPRVHGKTFVQNFLMGFADTLSKQLVRQRNVTIESEGTGLVLVDRQKLVDEHFELAVGRTHARSNSNYTYNENAYSAGQSAAQNYTQRTAAASSRKELH